MTSLTTPERRCAKHGRPIRSWDGRTDQFIHADHVVGTPVHPWDFCEPCPGGAIERRDGAPGDWCATCHADWHGLAPDMPGSVSIPLVCEKCGCNRWRPPKGVDMSRDDVILKALVCQDCGAPRGDPAATGAGVRPDHDPATGWLQERLAEHRLTWDEGDGVARCACGETYDWCHEDGTSVDSDVIHGQHELHVAQLLAPKLTADAMLAAMRPALPVVQRMADAIEADAPAAGPPAGTAAATGPLDLERLSLEQRAHWNYVVCHGTPDDPGGHLATLERAQRNAAACEICDAIATTLAPAPPVAG